MNAKNELDMTPYSVEFFVADSYEFHSALEIKSSDHNPFAFSDGEGVEIERFCSMICAGMSTPFPRSQQQLAYAVVGIKNALKKLSLSELEQRRPEVANLDVEQLRPEVKPLEALDALLSQELMKKALPNLRQAVRFMHEQDQQDIYSILRLKVGYV